MTRAVKGCLFLLTFSIPFYYADVVQFLALSGLVVLTGLNYRHLRPLSRMPPFFWWWGAFVAWSWLSLIWSREPELTRQTALMNISVPWFVFYMVYQLAGRFTGLQETVRLAARLAMVLMAVLVLLNVSGVADVPVFRPGWLGIEPAATTAITLYVALELSSLLTGNPRQLWVSVGMCLLAMLACWFISNRMVWIAFAGVLLSGFLGALVSQWRLGLRLGLGGVNLLAMLTLIGLSLTGFAVAEKKHGLYFQPRAAQYFGESIAKSERKEIWAFYWSKVQYQPWIGLGAGRELAGHIYGDQKPAYIFRDHVAHPHNWALNVLLQMGVVGLVLLVLAHFSLFWPLLREENVNANIINQTGVVMATLAGWTLKNLVDDQSFSPLIWLPILIWAVWLPRLKRS